MVGKVENLEPIITTTKNNQEKKMLKFEISDGRFVLHKSILQFTFNNYKVSTQIISHILKIKLVIRKGVKVTLFDNFGEMADKQFKELDNMNIFIIISCARVGTYDGNIS